MKSQLQFTPQSDFHCLMTVLLAAFAAGCGSGADGPPRVSIAGKVTLDGQPLESGVIRFIPSADSLGPAAAAVIAGGEYELTDEDGPVLGHHRVEIEATNFAEFPIDDEQAYAAAVTAGQQPLAANPIPPAYNRQSTLTADVTGGAGQTFDYNLQPAARANGR